MELAESLEGENNYLLKLILVSERDFNFRGGGKQNNSILCCLRIDDLFVTFGEAL